MSEEHVSLATVYKGWDVYQQHLITSIAPLSSEQLALRPAPHLRSIGELAAHIVGTRAGWFYLLLGEGGPDVERLTAWGDAGEVLPAAAELVQGLETTWQVIANALARWTLSDREQLYEGTRNGRPYSLTRGWVIWHLIEHDLHHGGELSFTLGMHRLAAPDL
ncbi:MAG: DinB family protein [Chloroflexota bacterium]|nr:DinB family protein [Chloroflexota bacterium]